MATYSIGTGKTYTTIAAFNADLDNLSAGEDVRGELYDEDYTETAIISAGDTVGLNSITLGVASGQGHTGTPNTGARVIGTSHTWTTPTVPMTIEDIEFDGNGSGTLPMMNNGNGDNVTIQRCLIHNIASTGAATGVITGQGTTSNHVFRNNVLFNLKKTSGSADIFIINYTVGSTSHISNNTVTDIESADGIATGIHIVEDADFTYSNNLVTDVTSTGSGSAQCYDSASPTNPTTNTNGSDDATAPQVGGDTAVRNITIAYNNAAGQDYQLASGDTDAIDAGTDLGTGDIAIDALGRNRDAEGDTWDLGAFERVAAASLAITSVGGDDQFDTGEQNVIIAGTGFS